MEILSISIDDETLKQVKEIQRNLGFKSRSKMLRSAISGMLKDYEVLDKLKGRVDAVFVLTYNESKKNNVFDIIHRFENEIKSELHSIIRERA